MVRRHLSLSTYLSVPTWAFLSYHPSFRVRLEKGGVMIDWRTHDAAGIMTAPSCRCHQNDRTYLHRCRHLEWVARFSDAGRWMYCTSVLIVISLKIWNQSFPHQLQRVKAVCAGEPDKSRSSTILSQGRWQSDAGHTGDTIPALLILPTPPLQTANCRLLTIHLPSPSSTPCSGSKVITVTITGTRDCALYQVIDLLAMVAGLDRHPVN